MSLETDVISTLNADSTLTSLLGANGDTKIYPIQSPIGSTAPYIVYNTPDDGTIEENLLEKVMFFDCIDSEWVDSNDIKERISTLFDVEDKIRKVITSDDFRYFWCKLIGGTSFIDTDTQLLHDVVLFGFKYLSVDAGNFLLAEDGSFILTEDGGRIILEP